MAKQKITTSSTAEYFSKNLQQVGFSSPTKAVLTTLKEAVDNSLDACEDAEILPELSISVEKIGAGTLKNTDLVKIRVEDNGPGIEVDDLSKVFGEYLASSKFGRGRCSRGQQGIGISAATTWAQLTSAKGVTVITRTPKMRQAVSALVEVDIKNNKGVLKDKKTLSWDRPHGVSVEFVIDGRIQLNGEGGLLTYMTGTALVNPHVNLKFKVLDQPWQTIKRVTDRAPDVPEATEPHPHTMKLGEFIAHSHLFGRSTAATWLKKGFSRITDNAIGEFVKNGMNKKLTDTSVDKLNEANFKDIFAAIQKTELMSPSTRSVMTIGEEAFSKSVRRLGEVDFFAVVTRKPTICDYKPVAVEVAVARLKDGNAPSQDGEAPPSSVLRFANRVPLQFDKSACAMTKAVETVNWRAYGLAQPRDSVPMGPYVIAISLVSPFIKFKNASKETVDASDELVEEIRRALMQAGQRLSRHIRKEHREADLEEKLQHIEQFCPILVDCLCRITSAPATRKKKATEGIIKLLGRDVNAAKKQLTEAVKEVKDHEARGKIQIIKKESAEDQTPAGSEAEASEAELTVDANTAEAPAPKKGAKASKKEKGAEKEKAAPKEKAAAKEKTLVKAKKVAKGKEKTKEEELA
ncbi:MAG: DNA topoisomerase VI subunit B [Deltaproteobacteria bacterium]|nr:DNA topoisomerase VI subunit B [Deltaproteobacteria bacterium]MBI3293649.1 DNA topoisomerase VI subunit B [Deltaproteobacteria bacterium]